MKRKSILRPGVTSYSELDDDYGHPTGSMLINGERVVTGIPKIEFAMQVLGVKTVTEELRGMTGDRSLSSLIGDPNFPARYREKLKELYETALNFSGK